MAYGPRFSKTELSGGKNILSSEHLQFVEGGATLDATEFDKGHNEVGLLIARDTSTGKYVPFETESTTADTHDNFAVLNIDFNNDQEQDLIVGEVIIRGSVYEKKLPVEVPTEFKALAPMIRFTNHF